MKNDPLIQRAGHPTRSSCNSVRYDSMKMTLSFGNFCYRKFSSSIIKKSNNDKLVLSGNYPAREYVELFSNLNFFMGEIADQNKMRVGLLALETWYQKAKAGTYDRPIDSFPENEMEVMKKAVALFVSLLFDGKRVEDLSVFELVNRFNNPDWAMFEKICQLKRRSRSFDQKAYFGLFNFVDFLNNPRISQEAKDKAQEFDELAKDYNQRVLILRWNEPWNVMRLMPDLMVYSPNIVVPYLIALLQSWYNKTVGDYIIRLLIAENQIMEINGARVLFISETNVEPKALRFKLRKMKREFGFDLVVANHRKGDQLYSNITKIENRGDEYAISGMDEIFQSLAKPQFKCFLHGQKFVMYFSDCHLNLSELLPILEMNLCLVPRTPTVRLAAMADE